MAEAEALKASGGLTERVCKEVRCDPEDFAPFI